MEFHRLLAYLESISDFGIRQSFHATERHLSLAPAQVAVGDYTFHRSFKELIPFSYTQHARVHFNSQVSSVKQNFLGSPNAVILCDSTTISVGESFNTELGQQAFQSAPDSS